LFIRTYVQWYRLCIYMSSLNGQSQFDLSRLYVCLSFARTQLFHYDEFSRFF